MFSGIIAMETLHQKVLPFILRRMKVDVLNDLPPKITQVRSNLVNRFTSVIDEQKQCSNTDVIAPTRIIIALWVLYSKYYTKIFRNRKFRRIRWMQSSLRKAATRSVYFKYDCLFLEDVERVQRRSSIVINWFYLCSRPYATYKVFAIIQNWF